MGKVEHTQRIMPMALHKSLDPLCPVLDRTDLLGALNASPAQLCARLIGKGGGVGQACKAHELRNELPKSSKYT